MKKILIVEDVAEMREMLVQLIGQIPGMAVSASVDSTAQARRELLKRKPDLVLLDEVLPGESSIDLLAEFLAAGVPALLVTGMEEDKHPIPPGAAGRLAKPGWDSWDEDRERFERELGRVFLQKKLG